MKSCLNRRNFFAVLVALMVMCITAGAANGRTINVRADGSGDYPTIQAAIDDCNDGDIIACANGVYTGPGNRDIDFLGKAITVRSTDPNDPEVVAATIIDCNGTEAEPHRGFYFHNGEDANSILDGLCITNGRSISGAGIECYNYSSPMISNCLIYGNNCYSSGDDYLWGGGIFCYKNSSPKIINCVISNNTADGFGGGICCHTKSNPTFINCVISNNSNNQYGGGISCMGSDPNFINCLISNNSAGVNGGGVHSQSSEPSFHNCTFTTNSAKRGGGVMNSYNYDTWPKFINCVIKNNTATIYAGGIYSSVSHPIIKNCLISDNVGGGILFGTGEPKVINCTIVGNKDYGIKYESGGIQKVNSSILRGNSPEQIISYGNTPAVNFCNVQGGYSGIGNIDADPCFVEAGYWDANDTPDDVNDDFWIEGDYYLLPDSLCIDAGDPNYIAEPNETDLDGNPRVSGDAIDMGAYEAMVSCFGINEVKIKTEAGKKGDDIKIKGTFNPGVPIDLMIDDVMYTIDDGQGHVFSFLIPAGSFELEGKGDKDKYKFHSPKGSVPDIKAKFDFDKCKFEFKAKKVAGIDEITRTSLEIILQAGANIAQEIVELEVKGKKGEHLEYKRKPKFECCPEM